MAKLDYKYITRLVTQAQSGNSDAFAELYAATYQETYAFAYNYLEDEYLAQDALQQTYIQSLREIRTLPDPTLFLAQLQQITYKTCFSMHRKQNSISIDFETTLVSIDGNQYTIRRIFNLPFTESQIVLMKYCDHMTNREIAGMMRISRSSVRRYLSLGRKRLHQIMNV